MIRLAGSAMTVEAETMNVSVSPKTLSYKLTNLEIYAVYRIQINAFTIKGDGVTAELFAGKHFLYFNFHEC